MDQRTLRKIIDSAGPPTKNDLPLCKKCGTVLSLSEDFCPSCEHEKDIAALIKLQQK